MNQAPRSSVIPKLSVPPPIEPKRRAVAYGLLGLFVLLALAGTYKLGPRAYNSLRLRELSGRTVYDPSLEPAQALASAQARAAREQRKVLVVLGGNWCKWCLALDDLMRTDASIREHLGQHFVVVKLDSAKAKALDKAWGEPMRLGVPVLVFLDAHGHVQHIQETASLERWAGKILAHDPERVLEVLRAHS